MTGQQTPTPAQDPASIPAQRRGHRTRTDAARAGNGWTRFGGVMMAVVGSFAVIEGVLALALPTTYFSVAGTVLALDFLAWGWVHLVLGLLVLATGFGLLRRDVPRGVRGVAIAIVAVNMVVQPAWMPAYPAWSIIVLVLDVFVLYALIVTWSPSPR